VPRVNFSVGVEGSADVVRAVRGLTALMRSAFSEMRTESQRAATAQLASLRCVVQSERTAIASRRAAIMSAYDAWKRAESALTDAVTRGAHDRESITKREADSRRKYLDSIKMSATQVERAWTAVVAEEARRREQIHSREGRGGGGGGGGGGRGGMGLGGALRASFGTMQGFVQGVHGEIQDARRTRAGSAQTLIGAMTQIGAGRADVQIAMGRITAAAQRHGMTTDEIAGAIAAAQTEFSVLGNRGEFSRLSAGDRSRLMQERISQTIGTAVQGRNLGADPGEFTRLAGMFHQNRISVVDDLLARTVAMAQQGAIEPAAVTRQAMTPILRRMQQAMSRLGPGATQDQLQSAARNEYTEAFAELQVLRSRGYNPRNAGQGLANVSGALEGNVVAEKMRTNLRNAGHGATGATADAIRELLGSGEHGLFEADPTARGRFRLREGVRGNAMGLAERLSAAGLSDTQAENIFAGGGHGNPQSLQRNWRQLITAGMGADAEGHRGFEVIRDLKNATLSADEQAGMADVYENSPLAELNRNEERRLAALTDNTSQLTRLSTAFADWTAAHPVKAAAVPALAGVAGQIGGAVLGSGGGAVLGEGALAGVGGSVGAGLGGIALGGVGLGLAGLGGAAALGAGAYVDRGRYLAGHGLGNNDLDWLGKPTMVGGEESVRNIVREHDTARQQRLAEHAAESDYLHGTSAGLRTPEGAAAAMTAIGGAGGVTTTVEAAIKRRIDAGAAGGAGVPAGAAGATGAPQPVALSQATIDAMGASFARSLAATNLNVRPDPTTQAHRDGQTGGHDAESRRGGL